MQGQEKKQPTAVEIPINTYNAIVNILMQLPYGQVAQVMADLGGNSTPVYRETQVAPPPGTGQDNSRPSADSTEGK